MPVRPAHPRRFIRVMLTVAFSLVSQACATKVITVAGDGGAGGGGGTDARFPAPFCIDFTDATGAACVTCYDNTGTEIKKNCVASTMDQMCGVVEEPMLGQCLQCTDAAGTIAIRACLRCDPVEGDCMSCTWSDRPMDPCKVCTPPDGAMTDSCLQLRPELR
jgi:hypothetical protein